MSPSRVSARSPTSSPGAGIDHSTPTSSNGHGLSVTTRLLRESPDNTFIFTNLVETDMLWGHRNDPRGFADALEEIDEAHPGADGGSAPR